MKDERYYRPVMEIFCSHSGTIHQTQGQNYNFDAFHCQLHSVMVTKVVNNYPVAFLEAFEINYLTDA